MNKRQLKKVISKKNLIRHNNILSHLKQYFSITSIEYDNGYFIFETGCNSVCHFKIKETPKWKYGIWLNENGFKIFGEHEDLIDKFKPSATYLSYENSLEEFINIIKNINKNPKLYFVDSLTFGEALIDFKKYEEDGDIYCNGYQCIREYNPNTKLYDKFKRDKSITQEQFVNKEYNEFYNKKLEEKRQDEIIRKNIFNLFKELYSNNKYIKAIGIKDWNKTEWICSPRYQVRIIVDKNTPISIQEKIYDIESIKFDDKYRSSKESFTLDDLYDDMKDIKNFDYIIK